MAEIPQHPTNRREDHYVTHGYSIPRWT